MLRAEPCRVLLKSDISTKVLKLISVKLQRMDINHGHKKCTQVFVSIKGNIKLEIFNGKKKKYFNLKPFSDILKVEPNNWVKVHFKKDQSLMVLCDKFYSYKDYIFDKKKIGKSK